MEEACNQRALDVAQVIRALEASDAEHQNVQETDWSKASITELIEHIMSTHHEFVSRELPRIKGLVDKVAEVHGENHPELRDLRDVYHAFAAEIEMHLMKEEQILFPFSRELDSAESIPDFHCGSLQNPIRVMIYEHEDAGEALGKMRALTNDFTLPEDGCNTYRAMLDALKELETDMHWHIHKENNILFPAIVAAEEALMRA